MKPASAITPEWRLKMRWMIKQRNQVLAQQLASSQRLEQKLQTLLAAAGPQKLAVCEISSAAISMFPSGEVR